eukprot:g4332.t1
MGQVRILPFSVLSPSVSTKKQHSRSRYGPLLYNTHHSLPASCICALDQTFSESPVLDSTELKPLPKRVESSTDDPSLNNPLARLERMGTGWFGVILDFEGVIIPDAVPTHKESWLQLAEEESKPRPLESSLIRAAPMKAEQAISEVLCWSRAPHYVQKLANRKEQIFHQLMKDVIPTARNGLYSFLETLKQHNIPIAVCSCERRMVYEVMEKLELYDYVKVVVSADDVGRCAPDPEAHAFAGQQIQRPASRCVVVGCSNQSCEAAHDCGMKYIAAATGTQPIYELNAADLVIKHLDEITIANLKQLFRYEEFTEPLEDHDGLNISSPETQPFPE